MKGLDLPSVLTLHSWRAPTVLSKKGGTRAESERVWRLSRGNAELLLQSVLIKDMYGIVICEWRCASVAYVLRGFVDF